MLMKKDCKNEFCTLFDVVLNKDGENRNMDSLVLASLKKESGGGAEMISSDRHVKILTKLRKKLELVLKKKKKKKIYQGFSAFPFKVYKTHCLREGKKREFTTWR